MSKSLLVYCFWRDAFEDIIKFLQEKDFQDKALIEHMKDVLKGAGK